MINRLRQLYMSLTKVVIFCLVIFLCFQLISLAGTIGDIISSPIATAAPTSSSIWSSVRDSIPTSNPASSSTPLPSDTIGLAKYYAFLHQTSDVTVRDVQLIDSQTVGKDVCFIVDLNCEHSNTKLQFSHLNEFMLNICKDMSSHDSFDRVSFTVYDLFHDKYGNTQSIISITASYKASTLQIINYDYHMSGKYANPTAFISCADSYYIHPGYDLK